jgi:hypothetical protein
MGKLHRISENDSRELQVKRLKPLDKILEMYQAAGCNIVHQFDAITVTDTKGSFGGQIIESMKKYFGKEIQVKRLNGTFYEYWGGSCLSDLLLDTFLWREEWFENDFIDKELFDI